MTIFACFASSKNISTTSVFTFLLHCATDGEEINTKYFISTVIRLFLGLFQLFFYFRSQVAEIHKANRSIGVKSLTLNFFHMHSLVAEHRKYQSVPLPPTNSLALTLTDLILSFSTHFSAKHTEIFF